LSKRFIDGRQFTDMIEAGARVLGAQAETVNSLNVFPVPDGDTGTNMNMTVSAGLAHLKTVADTHAGRCAEALAKGLLMGARGNSGVILSQLFRGFAKAAQAHAVLGVPEFAAALQQGVESAYQAVVKPVEGTILTVSREAAKHAQAVAKHTDDLAYLMKEVHRKACEALARTPEQLPILKQVGVVDSGGQGLVFLYEGFARYLADEAPAEALAAVAVQQAGAVRPEPARPAPAADKPVSVPSAPERAQTRLNPDEIAFPYDLEFFILLSPDGPRFDEDDFRRALARDGDSILIIPETDVVKVHVHTRRPGDVLNLAMTFGELSGFHLENMRETHRGILQEARAEAGDGRLETPEVQEEAPGGTNGASAPLKRFGMVAVAAGEGIKHILHSLGVDEVLSGGQTMNPSTEDLLQAVDRVPAECVFVLPNNSNIILAAEQAGSLSAKEVVVVPTKSIPQGIAAALAFRQQADREANQAAMLQAIESIRSGQITVSVRDTEMDGIAIRKGDYLGIADNRIVGASADLVEVGRRLIDHLVRHGEEVITILTGELADDAHTNALVQYVEERYPQAEVEIHAGGQPVYHYLFSAE
jgi:hypothetical protein